MTHRLVVAETIVFCAVACGTACHGSGDTARRVAPAPVRSEPFIAFESDLLGFRDWERIELPRGGAQGITHEAGRRRVFINGRPPSGSRTFPVGTILIKQIVDGAPEGHKIFAMVKRGGGYNLRGARGWEWFELGERDDGSLGIVWRGINAPKGEEYGGDPQGGCNDCHGMAARNDFVRSPNLRLD